MAADEARSAAKQDQEFVSCAKLDSGCVDPVVCSAMRSATGDDTWCLYRRDDLDTRFKEPSDDPE